MSSEGVFVLRSVCHQLVGITAKPWTLSNWLWLIELLQSDVFGLGLRFWLHRKLLLGRKWLKADQQGRTSRSRPAYETLKPRYDEGNYFEVSAFWIYPSVAPHFCPHPSVLRTSSILLLTLHLPTWVRWLPTVPSEARWRVHSYYSRPSCNMMISPPSLKVLTA